MLEEFDCLFLKGKAAFKQARTQQRAKNLAYGILNCMGKGTITGFLTSCGKQFHDWSSDYRLFQGDKMKIDELFNTVRKELVNEALDNKSPIYAHMDDTLLRKTGKKVSGTAWRRDPLGPPFHTNFIWGQRFIQLSISLPNNRGLSQARAVPVDLYHSPTAAKPKKSDTQSEWDHYKEKQKKLKLSQKGIERICTLRKKLDKDGASERQLIVSVDGSYTNETVLKNLPKRVTLIGRIRKDTALYGIPDTSEKGVGRNRVYGDPIPSPEQIRQSQEFEWQEVRAFAAGKEHTFNIKAVKDVRWKKAGRQNLQVVVIRPLSYRLTKKSRLLYRQPAYLICSDARLNIQQLLQAYLWRWEIEVNFREEKTLFGCGQAQVRTQSPVEKAPSFIVAVYAMILLAAYKVSASGNAVQLPRAKWYPIHKSHRNTTGDIINIFKSQLWARYMGFNFNRFVKIQTSSQNRQNYSNPTLAAALYSRK